MSGIGNFDTNLPVDTNERHTFTSQKGISAQKSIVCSGGVSDPIDDCDLSSDKSFYTGKKSDFLKLNDKNLDSTCVNKKGQNTRSVMLNSNINQLSSILHSTHLSIQGHTFVRKTLHKPAYCHHCGEVIWGLLSTGFQCEVCNLLVHERCQAIVCSFCTSVAPLQIKSPVSHCWSDLGHFKRKFCNVCRKRLEDSLSVCCEVCEYYCHTDCQDYAINDCKQGATYSPGKPVYSPRQTHHWREGNLPTNSKCVICRKSCWSSECLTGYRCHWCGRTTHAGCIAQLQDECDFGPLTNIMLPAFCVSLPRTNIPIEHVIGQTKRPRSRAISEDWSSSEESKEDSWQERRSPKETVDCPSSDEYVCVFDGIGALKRRSCRSFSFSKSMSTYSAVKRCLKTFHLAGTPDYYNVYEVNELDGSENKLRVDVNFRSQLRFDLKQPSILIRSKEPEEPSMTIRVYAGDLRLLLAPHVPPYEEVTINSETTAAKVVTMALNNFGCGHTSPEDYYLSNVCIDRTVKEQKLSKDDCPMFLLKQLRHESTRVSQFSRFELRFVADPPLGPNISLFVGNLKENLSQRLYECILLDKLGEELRWDSIDAIYYESGCLVLSYYSSDKAERAYEMLKDCVLMDKPLTALLLPTFHPKSLPKGVQPLLVFVNLKSGGCQGMDLMVAFRRLLNPFQVFNLDYGGPLPGLYCFRHLKSYKILVCGGDGTVGWTLSCLDIVGQDAACNSPAIAPLPLGTGNDLARVLRWGSGYSSADDPLTILKDVVSSEEVMLDRWTLIVRPDEDFKDETKLALELQTNAANTNEDNSIMIIMNNYFGIGIDADLALDFHIARSENPSKFNSRIHNKGVYFKIGLRKMINRTVCKDLHKQIIVVADGRLLILPPIEGLIVLNILSWGGGANPWGAERDDDVFNKPPTHYDGLLEVVGISGVVHMGQIYSGLGTGIRLAQAAHLKILLKSELPIQVDGEPFIHPAGQIVVLRSALRATMLRKVKRPKRRTIDNTNMPDVGHLSMHQNKLFNDDSILAYTGHNIDCSDQTFPSPVGGGVYHHTNKSCLSTVPCNSDLENTQKSRPMVVIRSSNVPGSNTTTGNVKAPGKMFTFSRLTSDELDSSSSESGPAGRLVDERQLEESLSTLTQNESCLDDEDNDGGSSDKHQREMSADSSITTQSNSVSVDLARVRQLASCEPELATAIQSSKRQDLADYSASIDEA